MNDLTVNLDKVVKAFGNSYALKCVNLRLKSKGFLTIFGPNGAGKTTLINIVSTLLKPTSGIVEVFGLDARKDGEKLRKRIGLLSHNLFLYRNLSVYENLKFFGIMYGIEQHILDDRIEELLMQMGLKERMHDPIKILSQGMQQRVAIARALIHKPELILLDEPYTGLDQYASEILKGFLDILNKQERTIIMTTHNIPMGLETCDEVAILVNGKIVFNDEIHNIDKDQFRELYLQRIHKKDS